MMFDPNHHLEDDDEMPEEAYATLKAFFAADGYVGEDGTIDWAAMRRDDVPFPEFDEWLG